MTTRLQEKRLKLFVPDTQLENSIRTCCQMYKSQKYASLIYDIQITGFETVTCETEH